jgi:hypothetical protein
MGRTSKDRSRSRCIGDEWHPVHFPIPLDHQKSYTLYLNDQNMTQL